MHPTWRDLVIDRLAADGQLRRRFLARCGPHGVALALSTQGGVDSERALPLLSGDEDWDALGDRIYALAPELEERDAVVVLRAVEHLLEAVREHWSLSVESAALARLAVERFGEVWEDAHATVALPCIDSWLSVASRLQPRPRPAFLAETWAELLPVEVPDPADLPEVQRFIDWRTLCDLVRTFSPDTLAELGYGAAQDELLTTFGIREHVLVTRMVPLEAPPAMETPAEQTVRDIGENAIRRVLADL